MMKKFTKATAKAFINKNIDKLKIKVKSDFDGMVDCVVYDRNATFKPVQRVEFNTENNMGIAGAWFVGGGRDYFTPKYENDSLIGFECYNCCGSFELTTK